MNILEKIDGFLNEYDSSYSEIDHLQDHLKELQRRLQNMQTMSPKHRNVNDSMKIKTAIQATQKRIALLQAKK